MKRFGLVLLLLGLMAVFSTQAMAVDIKVAGEYYAAGMYLDKTTLNKNVSVASPAVGPSTAFYFQRLRLGTEFVFAPGFKFITRADIMERWSAGSLKSLVYYHPRGYHGKSMGSSAFSSRRW